MNPYLYERVQEVSRPLDEVFAFFGEPENLERITPPHVGFHIVTPRPVPMHVGSVVDYTIKVRGVPMRWTTLITEYNPPHRFVDVQLKVPYSLWHHTHTFEAIPGGTRMTDRVAYMMPFGPLGRLVNALLVKNDIKGIFDYREKMIETIFG